MAMTEREELAQKLWGTGALKLSAGEQPLLWDADAFWKARQPFAGALEALCRDHYAASEAVIGGPWAEELALRLGLPYAPPELPERVLLVLEAVGERDGDIARALKLRAGGRSVAAAAVFNFGRPALRRELDRSDLRLHWLTDLETAAAVALQGGIADFEDYDRLLALMEDR